MDDDDAVRREIRRLLSSTEREVVEAGTLASARRTLRTAFDLVLLDIRLPDGSGVDVAEAAAKMQPAPVVMALTGGATLQEASQLIELGVAKLFAKPFSPHDLLRAIERVTPSGVRHEAILKTFVGRKDLRAVQDGVRDTMVREALAITRDNRSEAARLLKVTRQGLQHILRATRRATKT